MMFVSNSDSKLSKLIQVIFAISAVVGLVVQLLSILALTKSRIGKLVRKNVINAMYDTFDESIDEAAIRAPQWMAKLEKLGNLDQ